jgi:hypothetical protein
MTTGSDAHVNICAFVQMLAAAGVSTPNLIAETAVGLLEMRSKFLSVRIQFSSYHGLTHGADRTGATK